MISSALQRRLLLTALSLAVVAVADQPWKDKQVSQWSDDEVKEVLTDSPWSKPVAPQIIRSTNNQRGGRGGMGGPRIGIGGGGIGMGGGGMGRRGGGGGGRRRDDDGNNPESSSRTPQVVTVRWESALPIQEAELKVHNASAPTMDESKYAIAVAGLPSRTASLSESTLKSNVSLKRDEKKNIKCSSVKIINHDDDVMVVYYFPRSKEINKDVQSLNFDAKIGRFEVKQDFQLRDMNYRGKLEL
jgi:hypothetical protein